MHYFVDIVRALIILIAVIAMTPIAILADDGIHSIRWFLLGSDRCIYEPERPGSFRYQPEKQDASSCEQFARGQGWEFTGVGDNAWVKATQEPTTICECGNTTEKWLFTTSMGQYKCIGFAYSCTKPGSGCSWIKSGDSTVEVSSSKDCRLKANSSGGAYYGWNGGQAASKKPECSCVCGESRTHWYSEDNATTNWQFVCRAIKYDCLAPPALKPIKPPYYYYKERLNP